MDNIYDDEDFFTAYAGMERSRKGLQGAGEWHQLRPMMLLVRGGEGVAQPLFSARV